MHEYSLARALLRQVEEMVRREGATGATAIRVTIGEFSGVEPDLLQVAFADISQDSMLVKGELLIEKVALEARCEDCSHEFAIERFRFVCPRCDCGNVHVVRGEEMMLERVVLEAP
ncbi:MAG: hydrogenase maturation nickel metallochaperone HypA [Planctomycetaceae bacterium]|nr:hydrogenase maturation nickel metallochaperone HypA [Planctomycetales bacterium]MCB9936644.1 hydrogenase maturation nickel metallochaperone HypA [Planctomycetaceae bacterium]